MQVSYGSPGHKGVTHLMAVGDAEMEESSADRAVTIALRGSVILALVGYGLGSKMAANIGLGGVLALLAARQLAGRRTRMVQVSAPAPAGRW
jgi:hypothetical protein